MTANLRILYEFLDEVLPGKSHFKYGNASRAILKEARRIAGHRKRIISKKQVLALVRYYDYKGKAVDTIPKDGEHYSIKIPYSSGYIFQAIFNIFDIFDIYKKEVLVPSEIRDCYGIVRRIV